MSIREDIVNDIIDVLQDTTDPKPILVTREPFEVEKLAITQFPAILVQTTAESRTDESMSLRTGVITYVLRCYVRGTEIDRKRNDIVERVEETLETNRRRNLNNASIKTEITEIRVVDRLEPLGEVIINVDVSYSYTRGTL